MAFSDKGKHQVIRFNLLMLIRYLCPQVTVCKAGPNHDDADFPGALYSLTFIDGDAIWVRSCSRCTGEENDFELGVAMEYVLWHKCQNPPHSLLCLCAQILQKPN